MGNTGKAIQKRRLDREKRFKQLFEEGKSKEEIMEEMGISAKVFYNLRGQTVGRAYNKGKEYPTIDSVMKANFEPKKAEPKRVVIQGKSYIDLTDLYT